MGKKRVVTLSILSNLEPVNCEEFFFGGGTGLTM
jgi:hypothetical protein